MRLLARASLIRFRSSCWKFGMLQSLAGTGLLAAGCAELTGALTLAVIFAAAGAGDDCDTGSAVGDGLATAGVAESDLAVSFPPPQADSMATQNVIEKKTRFKAGSDNREYSGKKKMLLPCRKV